MTSYNAAPSVLVGSKLNRITPHAKRNLGTYMLVLIPGMDLMTRLAASSLLPVYMKIMKVCGSVSEVGQL